MDEIVYKGKISFINYDKQYATIDYKADDKKKSVSFKTNAEDASGKTNKKPHHYRVGDEVNFTVALTARGDKLTAYNVKFLYNTALEILINKTAVENKFLGFLKYADGQFFVKELDSYIFFPLKLSQWEKRPDEQLSNEAVDFSLVNLDKPNSIVAELYRKDYIPEYRTAMQYFKKKTVIEAAVFKVTPFAAYVHVVGNEVDAKIPLSPDPEKEVKPGYQINIIITHLSDTKIVVERV